MEMPKQEAKKGLVQKLSMPLMLSLTLGLAPFFPEPHVVGKLRWLAGGGEGMQAMDYLDFVFHGSPWVYLLIVLVTSLRSKS